MGYWKASDTGKVAEPGEKTAAAAYGKGFRTLRMLQSSPIFEVFGPSAILVLANHRLHSRPDEMSDARPPSRAAAHRAAVTRRFIPRRFARCRRAPSRCHLAATLRVEEELSCHCRRPPQLGAPPRVARAASRRHRPSAAPRAAPSLFCHRTAPLPRPAALPPRGPCSRCHDRCLRAERRKSCARQARADERVAAPPATTKTVT
jgi:hypothetical protein